MKIKYFIISKKYILVLLITLIIYLLFGILFSNTINKSFYSYETFNNCTSKYIAYDKREFEDNCYYYYGKNISFNLSTGDSIRLDAEVYQFITNKEYDLKSLLNYKNIVEGDYRDLENNEIAIPDDLASKFNLKIGDKLYLNAQIAYEIIYIFKDLYDIKNASINSSDNVIFIGGDSLLNSSYNYAYFGNDFGVYNEVYTLSNIKFDFLKTNILYLLLNCIIIVAVNICVTMMFSKSLKHCLYKDLVSGSKKNYNITLFIINILLYIIPIIIPILILLILDNYFSAIVLFGTNLIILILRIIYLRIKIS